MAKFFPWPMLRSKIIPPPGDTGGGIVTRYGTAPADFSGWVRKYWPAGTWECAASIAYIESGWQSGAILDTRPLAGGKCNVPITLHGGTLKALSEYSVGYFQLNLCAHLTISLAQALDGELNVSIAAELYASDGWNPWYGDARLLGCL